MSSVVMDEAAVLELWGEVRIRGLYPAHLDNFLEAGHIAVDVVTEFPNKKAATVAAGFRQQITSKPDKYKGIVVLLKDAVEAVPASEGVEAVEAQPAQVVLYNKPLHDAKRAEAAAATDTPEAEEPTDETPES